MTTKKIFGYVFLLISILLVLAVLGQLSKFVGDIFGIFKLLSGQLDSHQTGQVIGTLIYWLLHIALTVLLWTIGRRLIKRQIKNDDK